MLDGRLDLERRTRLKGKQLRAEEVRFAVGKSKEKLFCHSIDRSNVNTTATMSVKGLVFKAFSSLS